MKKAFLVVFAFSLLAAGSYAQTTPQADVAFGYSYLHLNASNNAPAINTNGFSGSLAYNLSGLFGVVTDFGVYHGSVSDTGLTATSYMFGPRFSFRSNDNFTPFVQGLLGGGHVNAATSGNTTVYRGLNAFAFSFGVGTDIAMARNGMIALRPQFDYVGLNNVLSTVNSERISVSLVFNLGVTDSRRAAPPQKD